MRGEEKFWEDDHQPNHNADEPKTGGQREHQKIKFGQQIGTIDRLLKGLRLFSAVPTTVVPQGKLLMAAAYIVIGGYVVLAGADFVDAPHLRWLNRVPGVHQVVATNLVGA